MLDTWESLKAHVLPSVNGVFDRQMDIFLRLSRGWNEEEKVRKGSRFYSLVSGQ